jgi:L-threonylcarbamoyladenylate synthase
MMSADTDDPALRAARDIIRAGGVVGMPTETVYGLAANALDARAVLGIYEAKGRPRFDPLIVHVADAEQAWTLAEPSRRARLLAEHCWPGPLTLVLPRRALVPDIVTSGLDTVAIRVPDHPMALALIRACGPLAAPSANRFGRISPTTCAHVHEQFSDRALLVLDGGPCRIGIESTVLMPDPPLILRPGGISREQLEHLLGETIPLSNREQRSQALAQRSPGMLASHYAPRAPLQLRQGAWPEAPGLAYLSFTGAQLPVNAAPREVLSTRGDLAEAAMGLFAALRRLDAATPRLIIAELVPEHGLGEGINDRLRRAAGMG